MQIDPDQARALFDAGGFFILPLSKEGTEFGIDGSVWAVREDSFAGVKFLPPGFHIFLYSAPASLTTSDGTSNGASGTPFGNGIVIRKAVLRFTAPKEIIVRKYDPTTEEIYAPPSASTATTNGPTDTSASQEDAADSTGVQLPVAKKTRMTTTSSQVAIRDSAPTISREYLKTLDPKLAPYPFASVETWKNLTSHINQDTLDSVLGRDGNGDGRCDALMGSRQDELDGETKSTSQATREEKMQWGKKRPANEAQEENAMLDVQAGQENGVRDSVKGEKEKSMLFVHFDLKRSWRKGASGEELTRDSRDKSWLLGNVVQEQLGGDEYQLLAQLQLSFILFTQLHNFSALEVYKRIISLLSRSLSTLLPSSPPISSSGLPADRSLALYRGFLDTVLLPQLSSLRSEFFEEDLPGLDMFLLEELSHLRFSLRSAYRHYSSSSSSSSSSFETFKPVPEAWRKLSILVDGKFTWQIGSLKPEDYESLSKNVKGKPKLEYNLLAEQDEEDEYTEEGEDAPVVVEM